ncbi:Elongin-A [Kickxella alabastrina]|uniref:Elongin-A n=1 Tax=Kickxella alabastrina TaxID=61397 RepID=A0ACC1IX14_9FUNG|nr:Elongin-A [Kickxella alabastrina]
MDGLPARQHRLPSLKELCQRALTKHHHGLRFLGITPHFLLLDALTQCTPQQLETLEHLNPHILDDNGPLWRHHCVRKNAALEHLDAGQLAVGFWREKFREMRIEDELRRRDILERVRGKMEEEERKARRIEIIPMGSAVVQGRRPGRVSRAGCSLMQRARAETRAHMDLLGVAPGRGRPGSTSGSSATPKAAATMASPSTLTPKSSLTSTSKLIPSANSPQTHNRPANASSAAMQYSSPNRLSPARSPAYSQLYSPSYYSSASSCSPTHSASAYSPPYVPEASPCAAGQAQYSGYNIFEDIFGVSHTPGLPSTVSITEQTRHQTPGGASKRKRMAEEDRYSPECH